MKVYAVCALLTNNPPRRHGESLNRKKSKSLFSVSLCLRGEILFSGSDWFIFFQAGVGCQFCGFVGCFPGEIRIAATEVSVGRGLTVNRTAQIERFDDLARLQLEVGAHQIRNQL